MRQNRKTALYEAVTRDRVDCVESLLSHPAVDLNIQERVGLISIKMKALSYFILFFVG